MLYKDRAPSPYRRLRNFLCNLVPGARNVDAMRLTDGAKSGPTFDKLPVLVDAVILSFLKTGYGASNIKVGTYLEIRFNLSICK